MPGDLKAYVQLCNLSLSKSVYMVIKYIVETKRLA